MNELHLCSIFDNVCYCVTEKAMALLQYSCLENPMGGGAWKAAVHGVTESQTRLSDFTFPFHFHALEKEMATHSSVLAQSRTQLKQPSSSITLKKKKKKLEHY